MKILIVSYYYTPTISPRAFRWTTIAEYWVKQGEHVDVICSWEPGLARGEIINGVHTYRVGNTIAKVLRKRFKDNDSIKNITLKKQEKSKNKLLLFLKYIYDHTWKKVYWPDFACLWYFSALRKAKYLLMTGKYDRLITVSIPFTCHMTGLNIKKCNPDILWIMDVGDPFYILDNTPVNNHKIYRRLNYLIERKIIKYADIITVTTETLSKIYRNVFPESNKKLYVIPPLISLSNNSDIENHIFLKKNMVKFVFVGTLYKDIRSPNCLLKLFRKLLQTSLGDKLELHFFGYINDCTDSFEFYKDLFNNKIFLHGLVNHDVALQAMKEANFLINIGNKTSYQLPSKVVEYMSSGKPIINFISSYNDSSLSLIKDYPIHINIIDTNTMEDNNNVLLVEKFVKKSMGKAVNSEKVRQIVKPFSEDKIIEQYTKLIFESESIK